MDTIGKDKDESLSQDVSQFEDKIDALIRAIAQAEDPESVTNEMVAEALDLIRKGTIGKVTQAITAANKATEAANMAKSAAESAMPRAIDITTLDTMGTDGSFVEMLALCKDNNHTRYAVVKSFGGVYNLTVGYMDLMSDNMMHVLTQVLTTHNVFEEGVFNPNAHTDGRIRQYYRSWGLGGGDKTIPFQSWSPWKEMIPEALG